MNHFESLNEESEQWCLQNSLNSSSLNATDLITLGFSKSLVFDNLAFLFFELVFRFIIFFSQALISKLKIVIHFQIQQKIHQNKCCKQSIESVLTTMWLWGKEKDVFNSINKKKSVREFNFRIELCFSNLIQKI